MQQFMKDINLAFIVRLNLSLLATSSGYSFLLLLKGSKKIFTAGKLISPIAGFGI
jgi:hypothetical protein